MLGMSSQMTRKHILEAARERLAQRSLRTRRQRNHRRDLTAVRGENISFTVARKALRDVYQIVAAAAEAMYATHPTYSL